MVVEPGQSIQAAINAAAPGSTIDVVAGTYVNQFLTISQDVTLQAVNTNGSVATSPVVSLVETVAPPNDKGAILVGTPGLIPGDAPNVTLNGFEISGVAIPKKLGDNGAAIRWQSGNLTLNDDYFHNNQEGLLGTPAVAGTGNLVIDRSEFSFNGSGNGQTHGIYVGDANSVVIMDSFFHDTIAGHEIKSRAHYNTIADTRIFGNDSTDSNQIDLPNGGVDIVTNDMIEKGLHSQNPRFIGFGEAATLGGGPDWSDSSLTISHTDFVNDYGSRGVTVWNPTGLPVTATNDGFWNIPALAGAGNIELASRPTLDMNHPWA